MAAIGIVQALLEFAFAPIVGFIEATQIVVARRVGQLREREIAPTFDRTLRVVGVTSLIIAAALRFGTEAFAPDIITSRAVAHAIVDFFRYGAIGFVFLALNLTYSSLYIGLHRPRILITSTFLLVSANILLSYALVLGHFGCPRLGIKGAGIAFAAAEALMLAFIAWRAWRELNVGRRSLAPSRIAGGISTRQLTRLAWPISAQLLIEALRWLGFFLIVERMGRDALAASSIVFACYTLLLVPTDACAQAIYSLVSTMIGRGQDSQIRALIRRVIASAYGITAPFLVFLAVAPAAAVTIFTGNHSTLHGAVGPLRLLPLLLLLIIPSDAWLATIFGTGDTRFGAAVEVLASAVVLIGASALGLGLHADLTYVWATLGAAAVVTLGLARARVQGSHWRAHEI